MKSDGDFYGQLKQQHLVQGDFTTKSLKILVFSKQDMGISAEKMRVYPMPMNPGWNRQDSPQSVAPIGELPLTALSTRENLWELDDVVTHLITHGMWVLKIIHRFLPSLTGKPWETNGFQVSTFK